MFSSFFIFFSFIISSTLSYEYETHRVNVKVDHFSFVNDDKFDVTVLINDANWKNPGSGPIFVYLGGEAGIESYVKNTEFLWEAAVEFEALAIYIEHRYYGSSMPYGNLSLTDKKYFGYLTTEQALADMIDVLYYVDSEQWRGTATDTRNPDTKIKHPIIAFGGSYGGMLAAWSRTKYPHVIAGALASSAPILQLPGLTNCGFFYQTITEVFGIDHPKCPEFVKMTWDALWIITDNGDSDEGNKWLEETFKLCKPVSNSDDVYYLIYWIEEQFWTIGMANYPYAHEFLKPLPGNPVEVFCSKMVETTEEPKDLVKAMFNGINLVSNYTGNVECFGYDKYPGEPSTQFDPWTLQNCMEMVLPTCSDGIHDMFIEHPWNITKNSDSCYEMFKVRPDNNQLKIEYAGKHLEAASNIIFSNGLLDPWSGGVLKENISETVITIVLPNGAHHLDLMASNEKDPEEVKEARKLYKKYFRKWIDEFYNRNY